MSERVLITGGLGFIGHHLAIRLAEEGLTPIIFDNYSQNVKNEWHREIIDERIEMIRARNIKIFPGDARNFENIREVILNATPDRIVHLSAIPSDMLCNKEPGAAFEHNLLSTKNILEVIRLFELDIKQLIYFSSSMVYGDFQTASVTEESPTNPIGIYGAAKLSSEFIIKAYHNLLGLPYTVVRPSALYGPRCINNRVTQIFIEKAIRGDSLRIDGDGKDCLDFTFIDDLIHGVYLCLSRTEALNQTFHLTYGSGEPIITLVEILKSYFKDIQIDYVERDRMKAIRGTLDIDKANKLLGYNPEYNLAKGYPHYIEWYLKSGFTG